VVGNEALTLLRGVGASYFRGEYMIKGSHLTEENKEKLRFKRTDEQKWNCHLAKLGNKYRLGCKNSPESNRKNSLAHKTGKQAGKNNNFYGKNHTKESNEKNRQWHLGKKASEETKQKMRTWHIINSNWKGRNHTDESKKKQSEVKLADKNPVWKGGVSFEPYPIGWRKKLKLKIKGRDNNTCQLCYGNIDEMCVGWATHHIDYDKDNLDESNLILLCKRCHGKTNHNHRAEWIRLFQEKMAVRGLTKVNK
jgi:hypothetical protein